MAIYIVDEPCGAGKTVASINFINNSPVSRKYIYVTPFLKEVTRIMENCPNHQFSEPEVYGTKLNGAKILIQDGRNVVTTHALFGKFGEDIVELIHNGGYTLIMDEVADVISEFAMSRFDKKIIMDRYTHVDEKNRLIWDDLDYDGKLNEYKDYCINHSIMCFGDSGLIKMYPPSLFECFDDIYVLTYMFNSQFQRMYFDYLKMEYKYIYVKGDSLSTYEFTTDASLRKLERHNYKELVHIFENEKLNSIGDLESSLSVSWYDRHKKDMLSSTLKRNCENYIGHYMGAKSEDVLWTTFKSFKKVTSGKGYARGFISSNCRATNEYRNKTVVCYLLNKYMNPFIKQFFVTHGIHSDDTEYALSELLQLLFRSAVRDGKPINIYIPSKRMRTILIDWLNSFDKIENNA